MGNRDNWSYIQIPKTVFEEVENLLKAEEFTKKGIFKPKDITLILLRDFIEHGSDMLEITTKVEKLQIELNTMNTMFSMINQNKIDREYLSHIKHVQTKDKETILNDENIDKQIKIIQKNKKSYCTYDKTNECAHTLYLSIIRSLIKFKNSND
jgi:hypothetical protein